MKMNSSMSRVRSGLIRSIFTALLLSGAALPALADSTDGPFLIVGTGSQYPTLQQAVDAASDGSTIEVLPCSGFGTASYNAQTYSTDNKAQYWLDGWGGEVYIKGKSLAIKSKDGAAAAPLEDFVFLIEGDSSLSSVTLDGLKLTGKSKILVSPGAAAAGGLESLAIRNCVIDVDGGVPSVSQGRTFTKTLHGNWTFANYTNRASILFIGNVDGDIRSFSFTGNTYLNWNNDRTAGAGRCIAGRGKFRSVDISGNTIGSDSCRITDHFMTAEDGGYSSEAFTFRIYNNKFYCKNTALVLWFTTGDFHNTQTSNKVFVHDNSIDWIDSHSAKGRPAEGELIWDPKAEHVTGGHVTLTTYDNFVNGYCFNNIDTNQENKDHVTVNEQPGHSYSCVKPVPAGFVKKADKYYDSKAYEYDAATGTFIEHILSEGQYCTGCDELEQVCAWCSLQELIDNAVNGATVTLSQNVTAHLGAHEHKGASCGADAALMIPEGKKITIDLNGYTIDRALAGRTAVENGNIFTVKAGAELTVKDSSEGGTGTLTGGFNTGNGGAIAVEAGGTLYLTGGNIVGNISKDRGGAIFNAGELNISGGSFKENRSRNGGSAIEQHGKMSVKGSFSFDADQYVRLCAPSSLTEASRSTYVITKAAAIASGIPVMLENESAGRDILVSGAAQVTAEDATLLSLKLSDMSLSAMFGNTAADAKKDAAIELAALPSVIIRRVGLEEGENAVFKVYYKEKAGDAFPAKALYTVSMNSSNKPKADGAEYAERIVGRVMPGFYKVVEQGWNWTYAKNSASVTPAEQKDSEGTGEGVGKVERNQSLIFTFSGDKSGKPGKHAEGTAVNNFRKYDEIVIEISVAAWKDGGEQVLNY